MRRLTYVLVTVIGLSLFPSCADQTTDFEEITEQANTNPNGHDEDEDCNENC